MLGGKRVQDLKDTLFQDMKSLGLTGDYILVLRPYSKTHFGNYNPNNNKVRLYVYSNSQYTEVYSYEHLLKTLIHETCHYRQWRDPKFKRIKGVMHNPEFKRMYNYYTGLAKECSMYEKEVSIDEKSFESNKGRDKSNSIFNRQTS
jgi:radical SAM superfamily enzyme YgiQ (UPF0313 family)